jgi:hypothetical protein
MKRIVCSVLLAFGLFLSPAGAIDVTVYDSVVTLATNVTQIYSFADPTNGLAVVVAVTMTRVENGRGVKTGKLRQI